MHLVYILLVLQATQAQATQPRPELNIKMFADIEIGMAADSVSGALIQLGYTVTRPEINPSARIVKNKYSGETIGTFWADDNGRVNAAQQRVYDAGAKGDDAIDFAEALYWLIHDEGDVFEPNNKTRVSTRTRAVLGTDDYVTRIPGQSLKRFTIETESGAIYIVSLNRNGLRTGASVDIVKMAPFPKKK
jgi:hypothetical protein